MKGNKNLVLTVAGLAMVVGFFLPWIDVGGAFTVSGWDFVKSSHVAWHTRMVLLLLPIAGALLALAGLAGGAAAASLGVATGLGVFGYMFFRIAWGFIKTTGLGLWMVLGAAAVAVVFGLAARGRGPKTPAA